MILPTTALVWFAVLAGVGDWAPARKVDGVAVERAHTASGIDAHRASVEVCTDLDGLSEFISDTSRFSEWIPDVKQSRLIEQDDASAVVYLRNSAPWPLKDRDMVYQLTDAGHPADGLRIEMTSLPERVPLEDDAVRVSTAEGEWVLDAHEGMVQVTYALYLDPGPAPKFMANRRLATTLGKTLANLRTVFPCAD